MSHPTDMANHPNTRTFVQPHAAVQTARIAASTTIGTSQEMPHGSTSGSATPICTSLPAASTGPPRVSPLIASKVAPSRPSFSLSEGLASWRGFQVSPSSRESLERLSTRFPQMLDQFQLQTSHFQTFILDLLAGLGDEMHDMLVSEVQETDLDRLKCIIADLSSVGIDVTIFRDRLDVVASARRAADLSSAIAMHCHEHAMYTGELLRVESAAKDLRIELEKTEYAAKDLRAILKENEQARDVAIADLEVLDTYSAQLDPCLSLDQGLL